MSSSSGQKAPSEEVKESSLKLFLAKLRKRGIIETLAAFIGGGWLLVEVVERLLVGHYGFPEKIIDITVVSVVGVLLATLVWRWFCGKDKRPGNIKFEVLLVPLILLLTLAIDLAILLKVFGIPGKTLLVLLSPPAWGSPGSSSSSRNGRLPRPHRPLSASRLLPSPMLPPLPSPIDPSSSSPSPTSAPRKARNTSATE